MGLLANSTMGFGTLRVNGLSRVPNPPTRISAFMSIISLSLYFKTSKSESNPLTDSHHLQWEKNKSIEKLLVIFYPVWHFNKHKGGFPCYNNGGVS